MTWESSPWNGWIFSSSSLSKTSFLEAEYYNRCGFCKSSSFMWRLPSKSSSFVTTVSGVSPCDQGHSLSNWGQRRPPEIEEQKRWLASWLASPKLLDGAVLFYSSPLLLSAHWSFNYHVKQLKKKICWICEALLNVFYLAWLFHKQENRNTKLRAYYTWKPHLHFPRVTDISPKSQTRAQCGSPSAKG